MVGHKTILLRSWHVVPVMLQLDENAPHLRISSGSQRFVLLVKTLGVCPQQHSSFYLPCGYSVECC